MSATLATANAILKEDYLGPLRSALNTSTPVLTRLDKNSRDIVGKEAWIPVELELNQGGGARAESAVLPAPGKGTYQELKVPLNHYYGTMQDSGPVMRQTAKGEKGSFGRIVEIEAKGLKRLLGLILAHDFYLGHTLGATIADGVNDPDLIITLNTSTTNMQYFVKNMIVDVLDAAGAQLATARTITAVDKTAKTITIDGATVTTAAGGSVVRTATKDVTVTPLEDIIDDVKDIYGVTTANFDEWKSTVRLAVGAFTTDALGVLLDDVQIASGKFPTAIYSDYLLQRAYFNKLTANVRYNIPMKAPATLDGGFRSLEFSAGSMPIPWIADRLCPAQTIYTPHEPDLQVFAPADFDFLDIGGDVWLPQIIGTTKRDVWDATMFRDIELGAYNRNSHGKMKGVTP